MTLLALNKTLTIQEYFYDEVNKGFVKKAPGLSWWKKVLNWRLIWEIKPSKTAVWLKVIKVSIPHSPHRVTRNAFRPWAKSFV